MGFSDTYDTGKHKLAPKDSIVLTVDAHRQYWDDLVHLLRESHFEVVAVQIEAQRRPAIVEPTGLGAVVEDDKGVRWVRMDGYWDTATETREWHDLTPVRVLSEGVK